MKHLDVQEVINALRDLGGEANWNEIRDLVTKRRGGGFEPYLDWMNYRTTMWQLVHFHCATYSKFKGPAFFENLSLHPHTPNPKLRLLTKPASGTTKPPRDRFSARDYVEAFKKVHLAPHQVRMLQINYHASDRTVTATQMATAMEYDGYQAANLHYGD